MGESHNVDTAFTLDQKQENLAEIQPASNQMRENHCKSGNEYVNWKLEEEHIHWIAELERRV